MTPGFGFITLSNSGWRPLGRLSLVTAPTQEPILLNEAKQQLRLDLTDHSQDDLIWGKIRMARQYLEGQHGLSGYAFGTQTWDYILDYFPLFAMWSGIPPYRSFIEMPLPPLQSVAYVHYTDTSGAVNTMSAADYAVDIESEPGRIVLNMGSTWPASPLQAENPIHIRFTCGFDAAGNIVNSVQTKRMPEAYKEAMLLLVQRAYNGHDLEDAGTYIEKAIANLTMRGGQRPATF